MLICLTTNLLREADKSLSVAKIARKQLQGNFPVIGVILPEKFSLYVKRQLSLEYLKGIIDRATECGVSAIMLNPPLPGADESVIDDFIATHCASLSGIIHLGSRGYEKDNVLEKSSTTPEFRRFLSADKAQNLILEPYVSM